jgi:peptidoglycan/LPS O-acetylase OafA/YrhL
MEQLPIILCLGTLGFVVAFGYISARATEEQMRNGKHRKSALSRDGREERLRRNAADAA